MDNIFCTKRICLKISCKCVNYIMDVANSNTVLLQSDCIVIFMTSSFTLIINSLTNRGFQMDMITMDAAA